MAYSHHSGQSSQALTWPAEADECKDDELTDEDDESGDGDESQQCVNENWKGFIVWNAWALITLMVLLCQVMSYQRAAEGEWEVVWRIKAAGIVGLVLACSAVCLFWFVQTWTWTRYAGASVAFVFCVAFSVVLCLPITQVSSLVRVETLLSVRSNCANGKLLDVSETLTFSADPPTYFNNTMITSVKRDLDARVEPFNFVVEGIFPVQKARIISDSEFLPSKTSTSYSEETPTKTLTIGFQELKVEKGQLPLRYSLRLNYTARLMQADCGSTQCGTWQVSGTHDEQVVSLLSVGCSGTGVGLANPWPGSSLATPVPDNCASAVEEAHGQYKILLNVPGLQLGSHSCPFAWNKPAQSWVWYIGACFLAVGFGLVSMIQPGGSASCRDGTAVCLVFGLGCLAVGAVVCLIAFSADWLRQ